MMIPETDSTYLTAKGFTYEVIADGGMVCVVIRKFPLPLGYDRPVSDLLLRLNPGYPDVPPDMWWFSPGIRLSSGTQVPQTDVIENYLGQVWQRWSRHFDSGRWKPGIDCIETFLAVIRSDLHKYPAIAA